MDTGYKCEKTNKKIDVIDKEILRLKSIFANSNVTTIVEGFDMSINEALVYLAQLNERLRRFSMLANIQSLRRRTSSYDSTP